MRKGDFVLTPGDIGRLVCDGSGPMVVVDHDGYHAVYPLVDVEAVVGVSERDAAIAERDRLRRELEALRDRVMSDATLHAYPRCAATIQDIGRDLDAILSGGES